MLNIGDPRQQGCWLFSFLVHILAEYMKQPQFYLLLPTLWSNGVVLVMLLAHVTTFHSKDLMRLAHHTLDVLGHEIKFFYLPNDIVLANFIVSFFHRENLYLVIVDFGPTCPEFPFCRDGCAVFFGRDGLFMLDLWLYGNLIIQRRPYGSPLPRMAPAVSDICSLFGSQWNNPLRSLYKEIVKHLPYGDCSVRFLFHGARSLISTTIVVETPSALAISFCRCWVWYGHSYLRKIRFSTNQLTISKLF